MQSHPTEERPLILVTNDDGVSAAGIRALAEVAGRHADVVVVAPDGSYSGKSHSFTVMDELRVRQCPGFGRAKCYAVVGTPVDCVKLGFYGLVPRKPDLLLSGINHGSNTSISVHYSGTVGAAREGALVGVPAIGLSLADSSESADFAEAVRVADTIIGKFFEGTLPQAQYYNVNIPRGSVQGIRMARMAMGKWVEKPIHFTTPFGQELYWLDGHFKDDAPDAPDTDESLMRKGYATMTPLMLDVTDYAVMDDNEDFNITL